jgi:hypothetical protein
MIADSSEVWLIVVLILAGVLPNEIWRMIGVVVSHGIDETSEILIWVRAVATAIVMGVVGKIVLFAPGALADIPIWARLGALVLGVTAFFLVGRKVLVGVGVGTTALVVAGLLFGR